MLDDRVYRQILGTPMGGKLFPIVTLYIMEEVVSSCLGLLGFHVCFVVKYVDDLLLAFPSDSRD